MKILYLSLGPTCQPVYYLEYFCLRKFSSPLDWQMYNLETAIKLYKNDFQSFFSEYKEQKSTGEYRHVVDTKNNILSIHNISKNKKLEQAVIEFKEVVLNRWKRLKIEIKKCDMIVFFCAYMYSYNTLEYFLKELKKIFSNKKIMLVNVFCTEEKKERIYHKLSDDLIIIEYFFQENREECWKGNIDEWHRVISEVYIEKFRYGGRK